MGTRADFYIGRGKAAEWLGSIAWDGYPEGSPEPLLHAKSESEFRAAVKTLLSVDESATLPEQGWPWPWDNSQTTDFAYAWDDGVFVSCFGHGWLTPERIANDDEWEDEKTAEFPDMSSVKNVTLGERSGMIVVAIEP